MKKILFLMALIMLACTPKQSAQQEAHAATTTVTKMRFHCDSDTTVINQLLKDGHESGITDANALIEFYARRLLGTA